MKQERTFHHHSQTRILNNSQKSVVQQLKINLLIKTLKIENCLEVIPNNLTPQNQVKLSI